MTFYERVSKYWFMILLDDRIDWPWQSNLYVDNVWEKNDAINNMDVRELPF